MARGEEKCRPCQGLGNPGTFGKFNDVSYQLTEDVQQLLSIWNRAKGKERDALLWGDEVSHEAFFHTLANAYNTGGISRCKLCCVETKSDTVSSSSGHIDSSG